MKNPFIHRVACCSTALLLFLSGSIASAADVVGGAYGVSLSGVSARTSSVRITGPNGYISVSKGDNNAKAQRAAPLADGVYRYEITETQCAKLSSAAVEAARRDNAANGRSDDAQPSSCREVVVDSGAFRIVNGAVPNSALAEE